MESGRLSRVVAGVACVAVALSAAAVARGTASPIDVARSGDRLIAKAEYRKIYDALPLPQQRAIPYLKWRKCTLAAVSLAGGLGYDPRTVRFETAMVLPVKLKIKMSGTNVTVTATQVKSTSSMVVGGRRTTLTGTNYYVRLNGKWRRIDGTIADYKKPGCGFPS
jgi:hypothetical protein